MLKNFVLGLLLPEMKMSDRTDQLKKNYTEFVINKRSQKVCPNWFKQIINYNH